VVKNAERAIKPGMFARVQVLVKDLPQVLVIDRKALIEEGESFYVVKVVDDTAQKIAVNVLHRNETSVAIEAKGIQPGDNVVVDKAAQLQAGERVKPL
jgi:multidrug efflux pump subunit AcrA (membrane-fusion protein)